VRLRAGLVNINVKSPDPVSGLSILLSIAPGLFAGGCPGRCPWAVSPPQMFSQNFLLATGALSIHRSGRKFRSSSHCKTWVLREADVRFNPHVRYRSIEIEALPVSAYFLTNQLKTTKVNAVSLNYP